MSKAGLAPPRGNGEKGVLSGGDAAPGEVPGGGGEPMGSVGSAARPWGRPRPLPPARPWVCSGGAGIPAGIGAAGAVPRGRAQAPPGFVARIRRLAWEDKKNPTKPTRQQRQGRRVGSGRNALFSCKNNFPVAYF